MAADKAGWIPIGQIPDDIWHPVIVWDDYHGVVIGKRDPLRKGFPWVTDLPYAFECGSKEFDINPTHYKPIGPLPDHIEDRRK